MSLAAHLKELKPEIFKKVTEIYLNNRRILAKEAVVLVNEWLKKKCNREISQSLIAGMLTNLHKKEKEGLLDLPVDNIWTIAALPDFPIPSDALPSVLKVWLLLRETTNSDLTIRQSLWVSRLYKTFENLSVLSSLSIIQAQQEQLLEIIKKEASSETSPIDTKSLDRVMKRSTNLIHYEMMDTNLDAERRKKVLAFEKEDPEALELFEQVGQFLQSRYPDGTPYGQVIKKLIIGKEGRQ